MKKRSDIQLVVLLLAASCGGPVSGQGPGFGPPPGGPPPGGRHPGARQHTANEAQPLDLVPANRTPRARNEVRIEERGEDRGIEANGIPAHEVGRFPNRNNPNEISEQDYDIVIPANPEEAPEITPMDGGRARYRVFGITLDGVVLEPGTAEVWMGQPGSAFRGMPWNYEALGGAVPLGLDTNYAHVQPDGSYHYHGLPVGLMKRLGFRTGNHSPMIGWAADGFPIYALYGYSDPGDASSQAVELKTSWQLREGDRPDGEEGPGGEYDGAFVQDYEYIAGSGDLDECNGRFCVTPEFPGGTYAYFLTRDWPVIPRAFRGTPEVIKQFGGGGGPGGPGAGGREGRPPPGGKGRPPGPPPRR